MEIKRDHYLNYLIQHKHNRRIKIITGVRRCGKSYLLSELFQKYLVKEGVEASHIIKLALDDFANAKFRISTECYEYVKSQIKDSKMYYLLLDEVQMMDNFEDVLNGFLHIKNLDTYVTGSNSKFLSSDIVTEFRGRGDELKVYPFSFSEFYSARSNDWENAWQEYYTYGGMPVILTLNSAEEKAQYLKGLFKETYVRDIVERNNIKNDSELAELVNIVASGIGCLTNPQKLTNTFKSLKHISIAAPTVKQYLDYLQDSFIVDKALRYDIKGKKYINTPSKYYFTDIGVRNAVLNFRQQEETHIIENVIYNELNVRGYQVDVGEVEVLDKKDNGKYLERKVEVDFVVNQGSKRYYIQSTVAMPTLEKKSQEERPLLSIRDSFKKIIIVKENIIPQHDENGITTIGLKDFLLNPNGLDL